MSVIKITRGLLRISLTWVLTPTNLMLEEWCHFIYKRKCLKYLFVYFDFPVTMNGLCSVIISPWKRAGPFIWTNLNPLHPRMLCAKFGWNWLSGFGEEDFLILSMYFSLFPNYLPLEKGWALHLNKLKSPSPTDALCQVWLKLAQWFWRRRWKCEKFTDGRTDRRTDRQTDDGRQVIRKAHLSFQLRWAKKR